MDYSGFYPNLHHDICIDTLEKFIRRKFGDTEETAAVMAVIRKLFKKFEKDVSRFSDEEIEQMYRTKISPTMNMGVDPKLMTGEKYLRKGVDIGNQLSQNVGILVPYLVDNYVTIVRGCRYYGRYTDDSRIIHQSKEFLMDVFKGIQEIAEKSFHAFAAVYQQNRQNTQKCKISAQAVSHDKTDHIHSCCGKIDHSCGNIFCHYRHYCTDGQCYADKAGEGIDISDGSDKILLLGFTYHGYQLKGVDTEFIEHCNKADDG